MKRKQFTETQIIAALKQYEGGRDAQDVCRGIWHTQSHIV